MPYTKKKKKMEENEMKDLEKRLEYDPYDLLPKEWKKEKKI